MTHPDDRVEWLTDLVRLEIVLWDRIDERLRQRHDLPLAYFEALYMISRASGDGLRIGDLAKRLRVTVGGTSKLVDRIEAAGLLRRVADPADRRASRIVLSPAGRRRLTAATKTYASELATTVDPVLTDNEQRHIHSLVTRLLAAAAPDSRGDTPPAPNRARSAPRARAAPDNAPATRS